MRPFSMRDKLGYTLGDLGCCCTCLLYTSPAQEGVAMAVYNRLLRAAAFRVVEV